MTTQVIEASEKLGYAGVEWEYTPDYRYVLSALSFCCPPVRRLAAHPVRAASLPLVM